MLLTLPEDQVLEDLEIPKPRRNVRVNTSKLELAIPELDEAEKKRSEAQSQDDSKTKDITFRDGPGSNKHSANEATTPKTSINLFGSQEMTESEIITRPKTIAEHD